MRRYHKWLLTLGLAASTPSAAWAGVLPFFKSKSEPPAATQAAPAKSANQQTAENIAKALRGAKLSGYKIDVQFRDGLATLNGAVGSPEQRALASRVVGQVPGVRGVDNRLGVASRPAQPTAAAPAPRQPIQQVQYAPQQQAGPSVDRADYAPPSPAAAANQRMAENIAGALQAAQFSGYDIEINYQNGVAVLGGAVADPQQKASATSIVSQVPGVKQVENRLVVQPMAARGPIQPTQHQQQQMIAQQMAYRQMAHAQMIQQTGGHPPAGAGHMGGGMSNTIYDQPSLPQNAWPSYAQYPNYAAVSYPSQYSASAFPYIGPFYPYPQVPMGWRKAQLEWDDGYWSLNFNPRTDRWWWFLDYNNW